VLRHQAPSVELVKVLNNLGSAQFSLGQYDAAQASLKEVEGLVEAHPELGHSILSAILVNLAQVQDELDQLDAAEASFRKAVEVESAASGPDALDTLVARTALSGFLRRNSRLREALDVSAAGCRWAESSAATGAASVHREHLGYAIECGITLLDYGRTEQAMAALKRAAALSDRLQEPTDLSVSLVLLQARGLAEQGDFVAARATIDRAQALADRLGPAGAQPGNFLETRNQLLVATGQAAEALRNEKEGRVRRGKPPTPPVQGSPISLARAAELQLASGHADLARDLAQHALANLDRSPVRSYLLLAEAQAGRVLGRALLMQGDAAAALPVLEHAVAVHRAVFDEQQSLLLVNADMALADCQAALGQRQALRRTLRIVEAIVARHRSVAASVRADLRRLQALAARQRPDIAAPSHP
jgi:eukaryotic-like serine/threonine-protein kinase